MTRENPFRSILLASRRFNTDFAFALYEQVLAAFAELGLSAKESAFWFR
ncbi:hypothetical protein [Burkholderia gladioli]|nr:hypothetical protein [Burkholderia gladioli]